MWSCDLPGKKMTDDRSESWGIASDKEGMFCSNDGQTEKEHNSPVDCLLHRSGQTSTEPGKSAGRNEGRWSFDIRRGEEYKKRNSHDIRTSTPEDGDYISSSKVIRPER